MIVEREIFLTPEKLQEYTDGRWFNKNLKVRYTGIGIDYRYRPGYLYFLRTRDEETAKIYIKEALQRKVRTIVTENSDYIEDIPIPVLLVKNIRRAIDTIAIKTRLDSDVTAVLVTGTEGKTGTKGQLHFLLNQQTNAHAILTSNNNLKANYRSLMDIGKDDTIEVNEVAAAAKIEDTIYKAKIVKPDLCFFTYISEVHMNMHKTMENLLLAKSSVVLELKDQGICIVNSTVETFDEFIFHIKQRKKDVKILTFGNRENDNAQLLEANYDSKRLGWHVKANVEGVPLSYYLPLFHNYAPSMSTGILLAVKALGYDVEKAAQDYKDLPTLYPTVARIHHIHKNDGDVLFYDHSLRGGLEKTKTAFKDLKNFYVEGKVVALLGSLLYEESDWTQGAHYKAAEIINNSNVSRLYTYGPKMNFVHEKLKDPSILVKHSESHEELLQYLFSDIKGGDLLIIVGVAALRLKGNIADKIILLEDECRFDPKVLTLGLSEKSLLRYKTLLSLNDIEQGLLPLVISNRYELTPEQVAVLSKSETTYTSERGALFYNFFIQFSQLLQKSFGFEVVNDYLINGGDKELIYNERYCKEWFYGFDGTEEQPINKLFGSFYRFSNTPYLFYLMAGKTHIHVGLAKFEKQKEDTYKIIDMLDRDYDAFATYQKKLGNNLRLKKRNLGFSCANINCGNCIDISRANVFSLFSEIKASPIYKDYMLPLLEVLQE